MSDYVTVGSTLRWNYVKVPETSSFVQHHMYGQYYWFDQTDPTWQGRQASPVTESRGKP